MSSSPATSAFRQSNETYQNCISEGGEFFKWGITAERPSGAQKNLPADQTESSNDKRQSGSQLIFRGKLVQDCTEETMVPAKRDSEGYHQHAIPESTGMSGVLIGNAT